MFTLPRLQCDGNVECSTRRDGTSNSRHGDDGDVFDLDVGCWFGDEHEGLVEAEEQAFIGFDGAFDAVHVVVAVKLDIGIRDGALSRFEWKRFATDLTKSFDGVMIFFPDRPLKTREMTWVMGAS